MRGLTLVILLFPFSLLSQSWELDWVRQIRCSDDIGLLAIDVGPSQEMYLGGSFEEGILDADPSGYYVNYSSFGKRDAWVSKLDSFGFRQWSIHLGGQWDDEVFDLCVDHDGNVIVVGYVNGEMDFDPGPNYEIAEGIGEYAFIAKYSSQGNLLWVHNLKGDRGTHATNVEVDAANNIYVGGQVLHDRVIFDYGSTQKEYTNLTTESIFLIKLTSGGQLLWDRVIAGGGVSFPSLDSEIVTDLAVSPQGDVLASGYVSSIVDFDGSSGTAMSTADYRNGFVLKLNTNGAFEWFRNTEGPAPAGLLFGIDIDQEGNSYAVGHFEDSLSFKNGSKRHWIYNEGHCMYMVKYSPTGAFLWAKKFSGEDSGSEGGTGFLSDVKVDNNERVIFYGYYFKKVDFDPGGNVNILPLPHNNRGNGTVVGILELNGNFIDAYDLGGFGQKISLDNRNGIICTGVFEGTADFNTGLDTFYLHSSSFWDGYMLRLNLMKPTGIARGEQGTRVVYPNPTDGMVNYSFPVEMGLETVEVMDLSGKLLKQWSGISSSGTLHLDLNVGLYLVKWRCRDGISRTDRIVIRR